MFVLRNQKIPKYNADFVRLVDIKDADGKSKQFRNNKLHFIRTQEGFSDIPGSPIAYWASDQVREIYRVLPSLSDVSDSCYGLKTWNNEKFVRLWFEISNTTFKKNSFNSSDAFNSKKKWFPYDKGGKYRKWYGNNEFVVNWENDGYEIKNVRDDNGDLRGLPANIKYYFLEGITWSDVTTGNFSGRYRENGFIFGNSGPALFTRGNIFSIVSYLNSKVFQYIADFTMSSMHFNNGLISTQPFINDITQESINIAYKNVFISKSDWDSFETSWDFKRHPFLQFRNGAVTLEETYINWEQEADRRFNTLKANEEELNRIFIDLYGLQNELTPEESDDEVTVRRADRERDVKSFLSYCVGVMFGRYSPDEEGLIFAGGDFDSDCYKTYKPDKDNVIPITDDTYFEDDLVGRLISILKLTFGDSTLEANLDFIAHSLNMKSSETSRQRIRRYFLKEFYKDHIQIYKKRPIYWLFDSGKQNGFKALVYLHRYESGLVARVRTDYLHAMERKYEEEMSRLDLLMESDAQERDRVKAHKQKEKFQRQLSECSQYDQIVAHVANQQIELDLDDGVKVNYAKFQGIVVPQGVGKNSIRADLLAKI